MWTSIRMEIWLDSDNTMKKENIVGRIQMRIIIYRKYLTDHGVFIKTFEHDLGKTSNLTIFRNDWRIPIFQIKKKLVI